MCMKRTLATVFLCLLLATPACTGMEEGTASTSSRFKEGVVAGKRGDYVTAVREWRPLAEQGHMEAQYELGFLYSCGFGVPLDYYEAAKWYKRAAEQGHAIAKRQFSSLSNMKNTPKLREIMRKLNCGSLTS